MLSETVADERSVGAFIKRVRLERKIGQRELARLVEKNAAYLNRVEKGLLNPSRDFVGRVAVALNLAAEERDYLYLLADQAPPDWKSTLSLDSLKRASILMRRKPNGDRPSEGARGDHE
jgi:transcriptional regulator with XRE-family HTH domain